MTQNLSTQWPQHLREQLLRLLQVVQPKARQKAAEKLQTQEFLRKPFDA